MKLLEGKVAIVTGAARGIGEGIAIKFAEQGANVAFTYVSDSSAEKATALESKLTGMGVKAKAYKSNAGDFAQCEAFVNDVLKDAALRGGLVEQIQYSQNNELVSSDLVGTPCASIVDSPATIVSKDGKSMVLYVWYDNEYGYSRQVIRFAKYLADVIRLTYY